MHFYLVPLVLSSLYILLSIVKGLRSPLSHVPGPWYSRFTGLVLTYKWLRIQRSEYVQQLHERYGRVVRISPNEVDFSSIAGAKRIHAYVRPLRKAALYDGFRDTRGTVNVFSTRDFDVHTRHRKLLTAFMSEANLKNVEHQVERLASLAVERIGQEMKSRGAADVMKWWMFYATDVIGELTFGDSFRMLEQGKMNQYATDLLAHGQGDTIRIAFPGIVKIASRIPLPLIQGAFSTLQRLGEYSVQSINRYERSVLAEPDNPKQTSFTKVFNAEGETMSKEEVVANAIGYLIAGTDTTSNTLTFMIWAVCRDPSIKARVVQEVESLPENFKDEDVKALPYLSQVMYETLRLYASVPSMLPRDVMPGGTEIDGYWMPGGTGVQTQAYSMHRDSEIYPDPERFDPSRWENPSKEMKDAWMPFGGGARVCIGLHLAQMEIRLATAKFFRAYPNAKPSTLEGFCDDDMQQAIRFTMYPKRRICLIQAS